MTTIVVNMTEEECCLVVPHGQKGLPSRTFRLEVVILIVQCIIRIKPLVEVIVILQWGRTNRTVEIYFLTNQVGRWLHQLSPSLHKQYLKCYVHQ